MSMTGGISFFEKSKSLFEDGATAVASSNTDAQNLLLGNNKYFKWQSSGSDDLTNETITITLPSAIEISRLFLLNHNLKNFNIKYNTGGANDFANVTGLDDFSESTLTVAGFARDVAYFEFDAVTTDTIVITASTTQITDAEKFIGQVIVTNELGTLEGYPVINGVDLDRDIQKEQAISGRFHIQKGYESAAFDLTLKTYPVQNDIDLLDSLHVSEEPFLVWLCGGLPDQFRIKQRGFKLIDLFQMQTDRAMKNSYPKNIYLMGVEQRYSFLEVV